MYTGPVLCLLAAHLLVQAAAAAAAGPPEQPPTTTSRPGAGGQVERPPLLQEPTWIERLLIKVDEPPPVLLAAGESEVAPGEDSSPSEAAVTPEGASTTEQAATTSSQQQLDEDLVVETNNVSAVLAHGRNQLNQATDPQVITTSATRSPLSCERAYTQCALRKACAPALRTFNDQCHELIKGPSSSSASSSAASNLTCSGRCLRAMIALRSSDQGKDLVSCDCQGDEYCAKTKRRSEACLPQVEDALKPGTVVSCSTATAICMADQSCWEALKHYQRNCGNSLLSNSHCSTKCNNSLTILHNQAKASKIITCYCDGSEEFPCAKFKFYTERFCLNRPGQALGPAPSGRPEDDHWVNADATDHALNREVAVEAESGGEQPVSSNRHSGGDSDEDEDAEAAAEETEYADEEEEAGQDEAPETGGDSSNQPWIPLLGGKYFANLHGQQVRQQEMERQHRQLHRQQHLHLTNGNNQQQVDNSKQQQQRGAQASGTGQVHPSSRRRHRRIPVSAYSLDTWPPSGPLVALVAVVAAAGVALMALLLARRPAQSKTLSDQ